MIRSFVAVLLAALVAAPVSAQEVASAPGGEVRVLDKLNGEITDITLVDGVPQEVGLLLVSMQDCRYPVSNPTGDAYAALTVNYANDEVPVFQGWMIATAPALNAMDHPRYDVWVLRCTTA